MKRTAFITLFLATLVFLSGLVFSAYAADCGDVLSEGTWKGVVGYHNGAYHAGADPNPDDSIWTCGSQNEYGWSYQCVQYVNKFYHAAGMRKSIGSGHSNTYFGDAESFGLESHSNGSSESPKVNDILCYDDGSHGHVAIITSVTLVSENRYGIDLVEQNWSESGAVSVYMDYDPVTETYDVEDRGSGGSYAVQGWLRIPYSCKLHAQNPAGPKLVHAGETYTFVVSYENTLAPPAANLLSSPGALDWKDDSANGENMSAADLLNYDASSPYFHYMELHCCDENGDPLESWLYPGDNIWVSNDKIRVVSQNAFNVGYTQNAWFVFTGKIPDDAVSDTYEIYFRPYHATGGYLEDWGDMHFTLVVTTEDYTVGQNAPIDVVDLFVDTYAGNETLLGNPSSEVIPATSGFGTSGYYQRFENGSIQVHSGNAYIVSAEIYDEWGEHGYATWAGFPISDRYGCAAGDCQDFEAGYIQSDGVSAEFLSTTHPENLSAELQANNSVLLSWNNRILTSGIKVYRTGSPTEAIAVLGSDATTYTDQTAEDNKPYLYFVSAYNETAESPASNEVSINSLESVVWDTNQVLGQNGPFDFSGIYEFGNLTIGDDVEITSSGISQLVLYVHGTLTLGKNATIRVRNGFYSGAPANKISKLNSENLGTSGISVSGKPFRIYPNTFGKGGDGGSGGYGTSGSCTYCCTPYPSQCWYTGGGDGSDGGSGFGGGNPANRRGDGISIGTYTYDGNGANGRAGSLEWSWYCGGGDPRPCASYGSQGGAGGYGGGVLTMIANSIVFDTDHPPRFLVSGQKGGQGGGGGQEAGYSWGAGTEGSDGEGGMLIIEIANYVPSFAQWNLGSDTYGTHYPPSTTNGGHGIQTGNAQKVFVNGYEPRPEGQEEIYGVVTDLATGNRIANATVSTIGRSSQSDTTGSYSIALSPGVYDVTCSKTGYTSMTIPNVIVALGQATFLGMELTTPGPLNIVTTDLPAAETTIEYNARVRITGGIWPYTYSIPYSSLPPGLSLDTEYGNITGTPTTAGFFTFAVGVEDSLGAYAEREYTIEVTEPLEIITESPLPSGTRGTSYFLSIEATGGSLPHTFTHLSGTLPPGISLSSNGNLSGTPSTTSSHQFTVRVTDDSSRTAEKAFNLEIVDPLVMSTSRLNDGIVGEAYNQTMSASGGYGNYHWSIYSGILPAGLSLDGASGVLSGTPTEATYGTIVFSVSDEDGRITYQNFTLQISDPLQIVTTTLPNGLRDALFSEAIRLNGGIEPFNFSYTGQLPAGLSLNSSTGIISGTPTTAGYTNVSITVSDSTWPTNQAVTQNLGIRITSLLTITTSAVLPRGKKGVAVSPIVLRAGGGPSPYTWAITGGYMPEGIALNNQTGELSGTPLDKGDFVFTVQVTDANNNTAEKEFFWHISGDLTIVTGAIPDGAKGVSYSFTLEAKGGLLPYQWRIKSGTLPSGLFFNSANGTIYGTPTTRQTYSFTVEVSDNDSPAQTAEKTYLMEVLDDLYVYTKTLPNGRVDEAYTATIRAQLGKPPYEWRLESGVLPPGLTLTGSPTVATLAGTPTEVGIYVFAIEVSDTGTPVKRATKEYTVDIYGDVVIETTGLESAVRGVPYSDSIIVSGGELPYTWKIVEGSLPAGLTLNSTSGHISGITNLISGHSSTFTVRVTDSGNPYGFDEKEFVIYVIDPLAIVTETIQGALQKAYYQAPLQGEGGISPYHWSIANGSLPEGLELDSNTGVISGHSVECGAFNFTVRLDDSAPAPNTHTRSYNLDVLCCDDYEISGRISTLEGVLVTLTGDASRTTTTDAEGNYKFEHLSNGTYTITPSQDGVLFEPVSRVVTVNNRDVAGVNFAEKPVEMADINGDGDVDLDDAVLALQVWVGITPGSPVRKDADVNNDNKIGLEEVIYVLQYVSGLR